MPTNSFATDLEILKEDSQLIVCRKPAGVPVQTAKFGQQDMTSLLKNYRAGKGEPPEIYVVHRLDQPVEGVMVFAKTQQAAASLSRQIQQKNVDKYYYAVVEGVPKPARGTLTDYLLRDGKTNTSKVVKKDTKGAKEAVLHYQIMEGGEIRPGEGREKTSTLPETGKKGVSLLAIQLETGRHHQIRVQLAHAGHPLVGDKKYNPGCGEDYLPIGLCSTRLAFAHPTTGERLECSIEPTGPAFHGFFMS